MNKEYKFTVGTYPTKDGDVATIRWDASIDAPGAIFPLKGFITRSRGAIHLKSWREGGTMMTNGLDDGDDLVPPPPVMKRVSLTRDDIPCGAEFRHRRVNEGSRWSLRAARRDGVVLGEGEFHSYHSLLESFEMRDPMNPEWRACSNEVPAQ